MPRLRWPIQIRLSIAFCASKSPSSTCAVGRASIWQSCRNWPEIRVARHGHTFVVQLMGWEILDRGKEVPKRERMRRKRLIATHRETMVSLVQQIIYEPSHVG